MSAAKGMQIEGARELLDALEKFEPKLYNKHLNRALRSAGKPILADAKARVPVDTGALRDSLRSRIRSKRQQRRKWNVIGSRWPQGAHAWIVEHGSKPRFHKTGKFVGQAPAKPYMAPAFDSNRRNAMVIFRDSLAKSIDQLAREARQR